MKVTEAMIKEKVAILNSNLNSLNKNAKIVLFALKEEKDLLAFIKKLLAYINKNIEFIKTLDIKDKYVFIEEMIKFTNDIKPLFSIDIKNRLSKEELNIQWKIVNKDIKKLNKLRWKLEDKYEDDDDDDFFNMAAWLL